MPKTITMKLSQSSIQNAIKQFGHEETIVDWFAIQSPKIFKVFKELDILYALLYAIGE